MVNRGTTNAADKVLCETPSPGKQPTRIDRWKSDAIRQAILSCVPMRGEGVAFRDLPTLVTQKLSAKNRQAVGSIKWYTTVVKLDLEVKGEIERVDGVSPQRLRRVK